MTAYIMKTKNSLMLLACILASMTSRAADSDVFTADAGGVEMTFTVLSEEEKNLSGKRNVVDTTLHQQQLFEQGRSVQGRYCRK
ncbi:MAG: hypothetical protein IJM81_02135 [Prevotella sp.]|nr:hypothetical protein [Prevotella sp.]